jgi:phosphotriesterase-related protein
LGFNNGPLTITDKKLLEAAARTHLRAGLTIAAHTANNPEGAFEQLEILSAANVSPAAWIWTHAHDVPTNDWLLEAAKNGAWISFDGYRPQNHERFLSGVKAMKSAGYLDQLLLSHDGDGYPQKGKMPSSLSIQLLTDFLPELLRSGFTKEDVHQLMVKNPGKAFAVRVRSLK